MPEVATSSSRLAGDPLSELARLQHDRDQLRGANTELLARCVALQKQLDEVKGEYQHVLRALAEDGSIQRLSDAELADIESHAAAIGTRVGQTRPVRERAVATMNLVAHYRAICQVSAG